MVRGQGQQERERAAAPQARAFRAHEAPVVPDHVAHHVEAQPQAVVRAGAGAVLLLEPLECVGQERGADPLAAVADP